MEDKTVQKGPTHLHGFHPILQLANSLIVKPLALYLAVHGCFRLKVLSVALALFELGRYQLMHKIPEVKASRTADSRGIGS